MVSDGMIDNGFVAQVGLQWNGMLANIRVMRIRVVNLPFVSLWLVLVGKLVHWLVVGDLLM